MRCGLFVTYKKIVISSARHVSMGKRVPGNVSV